jgi:hypothetical protein
MGVGGESRLPGTLPDRDELRSMYGAYRRRQARKLVSMLPRDAIRPLYRAAVGERTVADVPADPLEALVAHCATLLPLPPFPVWMADMTRYPDAHLDDLEESIEGPDTATTSLALGSRSVRFGGEEWRAVLRAFRADGAWRGFIAFEGASVGDTCRTAVVFRESTPVELRDRFSAFDTVALEAFLRSSLP